MARRKETERTTSGREMIGKSDEMLAKIDDVTEEEPASDRYEDDPPEGS